MALAGTVEWDGARSKLSLTVDPRLVASGAISVAASHPATAVVTGVLGDRAALARAARISDDKDASDAELVLALYDCQGLAFLDHLTGCFSIVIWDGVGQLILARDHAGTQPLFFAQGSDLVAFGSDIGHTARIAGLSLHFDDQAVALMLAGRHLSGDGTAVSGVTKVPPARVCVLTSTGIESRRYWRAGDIPPSTISSIAPAAEQLREAVTEVIRDYSLRFGKIGVHVTGGLDSGVVAALMISARAEADRPAPIGFTWVASPDSDQASPDVDLRMIRDTAARLNLSVVNSASTFQSFPAVIALDPLTRAVTSTMASELQVMRDAEQQGLTCLLSGWGGDEGASSPGVTPRSAPRRAASAIKRRAQQPARRSLPRGYVASALADIVNIAEHGPVYADSRRRLMTRLDDGLLTERTDSWATFGADHGLLYLYPLLDRRVLELALSLPNKLFLGRALMRTAVAPLLPAAVVSNTDKSDPARSRHSVEQLTAFAHAYASSMLVDPNRAAYVDIAGVQAAMTEPTIGHPGKLTKALQVIQSRDGIPLSELMVQSSTFA